LIPIGVFYSLSVLELLKGENPTLHRKQQVQALIPPTFFATIAIFGSENDTT